MIKHTYLSFFIFFVSQTICIWKNYFFRLRVLFWKSVQGSLKQLSFCFQGVQHQSFSMCSHFEWTVKRQPSDGVSFWWTRLIRSYVDQCEVRWLCLCLPGIQRPARLSPVTRPRCAAAKASSAADNGAGLCRGLQQTADCPLPLNTPLFCPAIATSTTTLFLHLCSSLSLWQTYLFISSTPMVCCGEEDVAAVYCGRCTCATFCRLLSFSPPWLGWALPSSCIHPFIPPSLPPCLPPSLHPSLSADPGPLQHLMLSCLSAPDSSAQTPAGPGPWNQSQCRIATNLHLSPSDSPPTHTTDLATHLPSAESLGCSSRLFPPATSCCRTMCECLRGIFRVTWTPSSNAGQDEKSLKWSNKTLPQVAMCWVFFLFGLFLQSILCEKIA